MKREKDEGLRFVQQMGISPVRNEQGLRNALEEKFGKEQAEEFLKQVGRQQAAEASQSATPDASEPQERNEEIERAFAGAVDGDVVRRVINWINAHRSLFERARILDAGCGLGVFSCYLAGLLPQSQIIAVDRDGGSVRMAQRIAQEMDVENVTFQEKSLEDLAAEGQRFDLVLALRLVPQNRKNPKLDPSFRPLAEQVEKYYGPAVGEISGVLASLVAEDGVLVSGESTSMDALELAWMISLLGHGLVIDPQICDTVSCRSLGQEQPLQIFAARRENPDEERYRALYGQTYDLWCEKLQMDMTASEYQGWQAEAIRQNSATGMPAGIIVYDRQGESVAKYAVYTSRRAPGAMMMYQSNVQQTLLQIYAIDQLDAAVKNIGKIREEMTHRGLTCRNILFSERDFTERVEGLDEI